MPEVGFFFQNSHVLILASMAFSKIFNSIDSIDMGLQDQIPSGFLPDFIIIIIFAAFQSFAPYLNLNVAYRDLVRKRNPICGNFLILFAVIRSSPGNCFGLFFDTNSATSTGFAYLIQPVPSMLQCALTLVRMSFGVNVSSSNVVKCHALFLFKFHHQLSTRYLLQLIYEYAWLVPVRNNYVFYMHFLIFSGHFSAKIIIFGFIKRQGQ